MKPLVLCALLLTLTSAHGAPRFVASPYKDLAMARQADHVMASATGPLIRPGQRGMAGGAQALTWAFASGECGAETWAGVAGQAIADANVAPFVGAGVDYIISTGGEGNVFTCASDAGMESFIARYTSARLIGFDFDIEATQSPAQIDALLARIRTAQLRHPQLRFSFTIATHAGNDGSNTSLNATGEAVLAAIARVKLNDYVINLMVMDFGPATSDHCVVRAGRCDMGASGLQAARNVNRKYGVPLNQIELTAMIGMNDVVDNVFTLDDAAALAQDVRAHGLAGLHYWSLDRDTPCATKKTAADSQCSGVDAPAGAFGTRMLAR